MGGACGGGLSADDERRHLADDLIAETDGALDEDAARCTADALHDTFGDDSFDRVLEAAAAPPGDEAAADVRTRVIDIFASCDALGPIIDTGS